MYYTADFKEENQSTRFDRWRINYDLLFRVIEAKENGYTHKKQSHNQKNNRILSIR